MHGHTMVPVILRIAKRESHEGDEDQICPICGEISDREPLVTEAICNECFKVFFEFHDRF